MSSATDAIVATDRLAGNAGAPSLRFGLPTDAGPLRTGWTAATSRWPDGSPTAPATTSCLCERSPTCAWPHPRRSPSAEAPSTHLQAPCTEASRASDGAAVARLERSTQPSAGWKPCLLELSQRCYPSVRLAAMEATLSPQMNWSRVGVAVFAIAAVLLVSMGGAVVAAPITVPLLLLVVSRHPSRRFTIVGALLAGLTLGEVAWAITYQRVGESQPWIVLLPLLSCAIGSAFVTHRGRGCPIPASTR